jgi:hypothetical protein
MSKAHLRARTVQRKTKDPDVRELAIAVQELAEQVDKLEKAIKPPKPPRKTS